MSTRLTVSDRENIANRMVAAALKERKAAHTAAENALAKRIYSDALGDPMLCLLADLPEGFVPTVPGFDLRVGGTYTRLEFGEETRIPYDKKGRVWLAIDGGTPVADDVFAFEAEKKAIKTTEQALKARIKGTLGSFTTVEAMVAAWPETEPYAPTPKPPRAALPAVIFANLNAEITAAKAAGVAA
jgi:hypothetical protein